MANDIRLNNSGVIPENNVQVAGTLIQAFSIGLKENVARLSGQEAMTVLQDLNAVKFNYKADSQKEQHVGFIAEEVPDLVATSGRDSSMGIVAVLTKAVQEQQQMISELTAEVNTLKGYWPFEDLLSDGNRSLMR